ncbi:MAG: hypothetical protein U9Q83_10570, partial [Bacteroidota bacterium]|nr:hypothetical protein [Bacteroidota bacterium]
TPHITGSKKQSEERAALFAVRVHVIVIHFSTISVKYNTNITAPNFYTSIDAVMLYFWFLLMVFSHYAMAIHIVCLPLI